MNNIIASGKHFPDGLPVEPLKSTYVEWKLVEHEGKLKFTSSATIRNYGCGQCIDRLKKMYPMDKKIRSVYNVWKEYHLNDMQVGTLEQMEFLNNNKQLIDSNNWYNSACQLLKDNNLYNDNENIFGAKWYYKPIPENIVELIKSW